MTNPHKIAEPEEVRGGQEVLRANRLDALQSEARVPNMHRTQLTIEQGLQSTLQREKTDKDERNESAEKEIGKNMKEHTKAEAAEVRIEGWKVKTKRRREQAVENNTKEK